MKSLSLWIFLGIVCAVFAAITGFSALKDEAIRTDWIECDAVITEAVEVSDSGSDGPDYVQWYCTAEYTREDGSHWTTDDITLSDPVSPGDTISLLYDPDSAAVKTEGRPDESERTVSTVMFWVFTAAAAGFFIAAGVTAGRKKRAVPT